METATPHPDGRLAAAVLPGPLHRAVVHVFEQGVSGCMLVGGTALSGYYAAHRRSDDLDLFTRDAEAQRAMTLSVGALVDIGTTLDAKQSSAHFYSAVCALEGHHFTIQVVLDSNLFRIGRAERASDGVCVAALETILSQKVATLVSRCSEKDLYDLRWLFGRFPDLTLDTMLGLGAEIDGGVSAEAILIGLAGARLRESACSFSTTETAAEVFEAITSLRRDLERGFEQLSKKQPLPPIGALVRALRR